jgi:hypothetical protein
MVQYKSEGTFDAPINKVWELLNSPGSHEHRAIKRRRLLATQGSLITVEVELLDPDGKDTHFETWKMKMYPPKGYDLEIVGGPMDGTKLSHHYTPMGGKTKVEVSGDVKVASMGDAGALAAADRFMDELHAEDLENVKKL